MKTIIYLLSILLFSSCEERVSPNDMTWNDSLFIKNNIPYMKTLEGDVEILKVQNAFESYTFFQSEKIDSPTITFLEWNDSLNIVVEWKNHFYYSPCSDKTLLGILMSESDYPIFICQREDKFIGEPYNLQYNNISAPLRDYCKTLTDFEAYIYPTGKPSEYKIYFGGWDNVKGEFTYFKSFIIIT